MTPTEPKTPELDKMAAVRVESRPISSFLEWLDEKNVRLARYEGGDYLEELSTSKEKLLAEYFEIDLVKVEEERRKLLDYQRALNAKNVLP